MEQVPAAHYQRGPPPPPPALQCLLTQSPIICIHDTWAWSYISTWHLAKRHLLLSKTPTSCLGHLLMMSILNTSRITLARCSKVLRMLSHVGLTHHLTRPNPLHTNQVLSHDSKPQECTQAIVFSTHTDQPVSSGKLKSDRFSFHLAPSSQSSFPFLAFRHNGHRAPKVSLKDQRNPQESESHMCCHAGSHMCTWVLRQREAWSEQIRDLVAAEIEGRKEAKEG